VDAKRGRKACLLVVELAAKAKMPETNKLILIQADIEYTIGFYDKL
jgi:hypothetical protein